jgi:hypothetical protein
VLLLIDILGLGDREVMPKPIDKRCSLPPTKTDVTCQNSKHILEGAGHLLLAESPDELVVLVMQVLDARYRDAL